MVLWRSLILKLLVSLPAALFVAVVVLVSLALARVTVVPTSSTSSSPSEAEEEDCDDDDESVAGGRYQSPGKATPDAGSVVTAEREAAWC